MIDKDRHLLRNQIKEKDDEIRNLKNEWKLKGKDKLLGQKEVEAKLVKTEIEVKQ